MKVRIYLVITLFCFSIGLQSQYPAELLEFHKEVSLKKNKLKTKVTKLLQINNPDGDDYTDTYLYFSKGDDIKVHTVRIEDAQGKVLRELKKKEIKIQSSVAGGALYTDDFVKYFKPKWHEYPYRIYYEYTRVVDKFLFLSRWSPVTRRDVPTRSGTLTVTLPEDYSVNMSYPDAIPFSRKELDQEIIYTWKVSNMLPPDLEAHGPALESILPTVLVVPQNFTFGLEGSLATWNDYGQWQYRMNEGLRELPDSEKQKIDELVNGLTDPKEIIAILYRYLQENHRYILVAIDTGGLKPYPASYVCEKRYGDCKALTNFMQAMLDYVKIPSFYVKVYAGDNPVPLKTNIPGQQFNHVILGVPVEGDTMWLENTSNAHPSGYLGTFTQNRKGLLVDPTDSRLIDLPPLIAEKPTQHSIFNFVLDDSGKGTLRIATTVTNQDFESLNYYRNNKTVTKIKQALTYYFPLSNTALVDFEFNQPDRSRPTLELTTNWRTKRQFQKIGNRKVFASLPFSTFDLEKPEERSQPVVFNYPVFESFEVNYEIPDLDKYKVELPAPVLIETPFGSLSVSASVIDGALKIQQERIIQAGAFSLEIYPELYDFMENTEKVTKKFLIICTPE